MFNRDRNAIESIREEDRQWYKEVEKAVAVINATTPEESVSQLRQFAKTGLLLPTDVLSHPERFFIVHRLLAGKATRFGNGFWVRFTVHYNLCYGTVVASGSDAQLKDLVRVAKEGTLGCFCLTERFAGVNSGLVVQTVAHWDPEKERFRLHSPDEGAVKNWISGALFADQACVIADLIMPDGTHKGPHAFLVNMREKQKLLPGIELKDMGLKSVANDLDNASVKFTNFHVPKSALLDRYCGIEGSSYIKKSPDAGVTIAPFEVIGQRLFTGRIAVAQAALEFARGLFCQTKDYTDGKQCWGPAGEKPSLSAIPQLRLLYAEADEKIRQADAYVEAVEKELCKVLRSKGVPSQELQRAIAVAKVQAVEIAIVYCFRLKQEVGSYALMVGSGFEMSDFLQACKFAEGDSRILLQKIARDRMVAFKNRKKEGVPEEEQLCMKIAQAMMGKKGKDLNQAWNDQFENVTALAQRVVDRVFAEWSPKKSKL